MRSLFAQMYIRGGGGGGGKYTVEEGCRRGPF